MKRKYYEIVFKLFYPILKRKIKKLGLLNLREGDKKAVNKLDGRDIQEKDLVYKLLVLEVGELILSHTPLETYISKAPDHLFTLEISPERMPTRNADFYIFFALFYYGSNREQLDFLYNRKLYLVDRRIVSIVAKEKIKTAEGKFQYGMIFRYDAEGSRRLHII